MAGGVVMILILIMLVVAAAIGVVGYFAGWWLTVADDQSGRGNRSRPTHKTVEDEGNQKIMGEPGDPK